MDSIRKPENSRAAPMARNAFGEEIPSLAEILSDPVVESYIKTTLLDVLRYLGNTKEAAAALVDAVLSCVDVPDIEEYEQRGHDFLKDAGVVDAVPDKLAGRSEVIFHQVSPYVKGQALVDLGCGDGKIGECFHVEGKSVFLADVYEHANINNGTGLPFCQIHQGERLPYEDDFFDTTLLLTVLHHADDPVGTFKEAVRVTRPEGRIILVESVYGVGVNVEAGTNDGLCRFLLLNGQAQRLSNIFFDHFYNRLIHYSTDAECKVNVPFNFNTPHGWRQVFEQNGTRQIALDHLGIDQRVVPEYHTLHVVKVL